MAQAISEIRRTFGDNLKKLLARNNRSIVETCTSIGVNRTQFNKYLSGASSPRPEVLQRICDYFDVDARVLLEPLSQQPSWNSGQALAREIANQIAHKDCTLDDNHLPPGFYRQWLSSHTQPGKIYTSLILIKEGLSGTKTWKARSRASAGRFRDHRMDCNLMGVVFPQRAGFAVVSFLIDSYPVQFTYFKYGFNGHERFHTGYSFAGHLETSFHQLFCPTFIERIPQTAPAVMTAARGTGYLERGQTPDYATEILDLLQNNQPASGKRPWIEQ